MSETQSFHTTLRQVGNNTGIQVPDDVIEALGAGKKPPVVVTVNGFEYRSTVAVMGGRFMIAFSSDKRAATGIGGGDEIDVTLTLDTAPRTVEVPEELAAAFAADAALAAAWEKVSPSQKKAHVTNIEGAKAPETRARRVEAVIAKLSA